MSLKLTSTRFLGAAKEASYGVAPTTGFKWLPVRNPDAEHTIKYVKDQGYRGVAADLFGEYQGVESGKFSYELDWYQTDTPILLPAIVGPDVVTGTGAPYTHTFKLAAAEPSSLTFEDYNAVEQWEMVGAYLSQLSLKWDSEGALTASVQGESFAPTVKTKGSPTYASEAYFLGWEVSATIGGSPTTHLVDGQIDFKRKLTPRWGSGDSQTPKQIFVGPLEVSGKFTADVEDTTEHDYYKNNTQPIVVVKLTDPTSNDYIQVTMSKCAIDMAKYASGKDWMQLDANFSAIYNATDAGPAAVVVANGQSSTY